MARRQGRRWSAAIVLALGVPAVAPAMDRVPSCVGSAPAAASGEAEAAIDGMTLRLKSGREMRLAGIVAATEFDGDRTAAEAARRTLHEMAAGRRLTVHAKTAAADRHGRVMGQVTIGDRWVQGALVHAGAARVMPGSGDPDCAAELLRLERHARDAGAGLWRGADLSAERLTREFADGGRFAVVEGIVRHVGESGGRLFLDFGRRYRDDFTIVIPREAHAAFADAGVDLRRLSGTRVRARGMLFSWGGPAMELRVPAALELAGTDGQ